MQVQRVNNNSFCTGFGAGIISLKRVEAKDLLNYNAIKKIAETDKLDIKITKEKETKYLPTNDCYIIFALKDIPKSPFLAHGVGCAVVDKHAHAQEVSNKIYNAVIHSVKNLANNVKKHTGIKPEFLKYLND